jgi:hypothetical protein
MVEDMSRNKCVFLFRFEYHMFSVLLALSHMLRLIGTPLRSQTVFTAILLPGLFNPLVLATEMGPYSLGTGSGAVQGLGGVTEGNNATSGLCPSIHKTGYSSFHHR